MKYNAELTYTISFEAEPRITIIDKLKSMVDKDE